MSVNSGNYGRLLEPGLRKIFLETYKEKPEQFSQIFNVLSSQKAIETDLRMGGFSMWNEKGSLDGTEYEDATTTDTVLYKHTTFSKGFQVEKEMVDDEQYSVINKMPKALARAARATIETKAAELFNGAFTASSSNWKGEALIANNHARLDGGTTTNLASGVLNEANLELALKLAHEQVDERGLKIQMNPDILVVPRALEYTAIKLMDSTLSTVPGGTGGNFARNDINAIRGRLKVVVMDYLTSATNWFVLDSQIHQLNWFWREKLSFKNDTDFDTDVAKYKGRMRFSYGWSDHRGVIGSTGV
jgi:phage major head subunit gpT-like protein